MRLPTNFRVKMIRLWRGALFVGRMHGHLNASEVKGRSRGAIGFQRDPTACWGDFLTAAMIFNKRSEQRAGEGVGASFLHIRGQKVGQRAIHPRGTNRHCNHPGNLEHLSYLRNG